MKRFLPPPFRRSPIRLVNQLPVLTAGALIVAACGEGPVTPDVADPSFDIMDAVHSGGNEHFFWLPPMVGNPGSFNGTFDGEESAEVKICEWTGSACVLPLLAEFSMTTGPGSETVRVVPLEEHYIVNWHTDEFATTPGPTYRISVLVAGTELGLADMQLGATGKDVRNITTNEIIGLKDGRTLPIKFRIEEGAVFVVGSGGGTFVGAGGQVTLDVPPGALPPEQEVGITVDAVAEPPAGVGLVAGAVFDFLPDGTQFLQPILITIGYDEARLPPGFDETKLTLAFEGEGNLWDEVLSATVDTEANTVSGLVSHFTPGGASKKPDSVVVTPANAELLLPDGTTTFTAVAYLNNAALTDVTIRFSSADHRVATVDDQSGLVTAVAAGTTTITARSVGVTGDADVTVVSPIPPLISVILNDPFADSLVTGLSTPSPHDAMEATLDQCATGISQGNPTTVADCLANARSQVAAATENPTDRVLLAVFDRLLDFAQRLLNPVND